MHPTTLKILGKLFGVTGVLAFAMPITATAVPTLRITDLVTLDSVTIADGSRSDVFEAANIINYNHAVGSWYLTIFTGIVAGTAMNPIFSIESVDGNSPDSGILKIEFSQTGFGGNGPVSLAAAVHVGGVIGGATATGTLTFSTYADATNSLFGTGTALTNQSFAGGSFSGSTLGGTVLNAPYSLTEVILLQHKGIGRSAYHTDLEVTTLPSVPDGGTTAGLIGLGLLGISVARFGRKSWA